MTDTKNHSAGGPPASLQGRLFSPRSRQELIEAVELAFDYRGDVTIELRTGESLCGYLFNRDATESGGWLEIFPAQSRETRRLSYDDVVRIAFTGEDTASGKSWEQWVAKKESERQQETARIAAEAHARGHL